jgi:hypothetical protein
MTNMNTTAGAATTPRTFTVTVEGTLTETVTYKGAGAAHVKAVYTGEGLDDAHADTAARWAKIAGISAGTVSFDMVERYGKHAGTYESIAWYLIHQDGTITQGGDRDEGFEIPADAPLG